MKHLKPGDSLGSFRIGALIGAGGMGEVYRAQDVRLRRSVAIKVLPDSLARDPERRARLEREAHALAALNHPNIGAIYELEHGDDWIALVLELIEGPTLEERLATGPLTVVETVAIARQLADALEAAHDRGIVHRDLKPANIKVSSDGTVKVLDFGLAKAIASDSSIANGRTVKRTDTELGVVMGTAAYMSPEQARGLSVDKRTDIWSFGCVVFEMCTGEPPFQGATFTDTLAAVIEREPPWQRLPSTTPAHLRRLLERCLEKDAKLRLRDIGEARVALASDTRVKTEVSARATTRSRVPALTMATALVAAVIALGMFAWPERPAAPVATPPIRFLVAPPDGGSFVVHPARTFHALSPDGTQLAYVAATDQARVWLRPIADTAARALPGTEGATSLFWSPDSRTIAFFADGLLKRIALAGGGVVTIAAIPASGLMHGSWGADGTILFGLSNGTEISRVSASGGTPEEMIVPNRASGETRVHWPAFLPDGRRFLYTTRFETGEGRLRVGDLGGSPAIDVMPVTSNTAWVDPDTIVFVRDGVLMGQRVDPTTWQTIDEPFIVAEHSSFFLTTSRSMFSAARNGTLAYHDAIDAGQLVWTDAAGARVGEVGAPGDYEYQSSRVSRDGSAVFTARRQAGIGTYDVWRLDLVRGIEERLTDDRSSEVTPLLLGDERTLLFASDRAGSVPQLFRMDLASGGVEELLPAGAQQLVMDVFPDEQAALYLQRSAQGQFDIHRLPLTAEGVPELLVGSSFDKADARLSPDGRALAFVAVSGAGRDVFVAPVPVTRAPMLVASGVRGNARWSGDGAELFYIGPEGRMTAVDVRTMPSFAVGNPRELFTVDNGGQLHDVTSDGRFLLLVPTIRGAATPLTISVGAVTPASD